jgi:predicted transglutaminase-like cysteine proteinase
MKNKIIKLLGGYTEKEYENIQNDNDILYEEVGKHIKTITEQTEEIDVQDQVITDYESKLNMLVEEIYPHNSLSEFKGYLEQNMKAVYKYQTMSDGTRVFPHKFIQSDKMTNEYYDSLIKANGLTFDNFQNAEDVVVGIIKFVHNEKQRIGYKSDKENYGVLEHWESPAQAYANFTLEIPQDCEGYMILEYTLIKRALILRNLWEANKWRLRCFIVDVVGEGLHASLAWVKSSCADWINLETTYAEDRFEYCWANDKVLSGNWLYDVQYSFNEDNCYIKSDMQ